jgi:NADH-quinone oxidoreductase subunit E
MERMSDAVAQQAEEQEPVIDLSLANKIIDKYIDMPGNLMPVLQASQDEYGYIPRVVADLIAERLNVYPSQIYGVLTFYAQFHLKPRGRFIIRVCVGTACHVQGAPRIVESFFDKLHIGHAETSPDLRYTFEKVACLGACGMAPLAMVNDSTYGAMTVQKVDDIVADYNQRPMK